MKNSVPEFLGLLETPSFLRGRRSSRNCWYSAVGTHVAIYLSQRLRHNCWPWIIHSGLRQNAQYGNTLVDYDFLKKEWMRKTCTNLASKNHLGLWSPYIHQQHLEKCHGSYGHQDLFHLEKTSSEKPCVYVQTCTVLTVRLIPAQVVPVRSRTYKYCRTRRSAFCFLDDGTGT